MECLGFKPGAAGWKAQTKPRSYGSHPIICNLNNKPTTQKSVTLGMGTKKAFSSEFKMLKCSDTYSDQFKSFNKN